MAGFQILAAGDSALLVHAEPRIDAEVNAWCIALAATVRSRLPFAMRDVVVGYCSVTMYFDPLGIDVRWLEQEVATIAGELYVDETGEGEQVEVPVCYGGHYGPDIGDVARFGSCTEEEVVSLHSGSTYRVYLVGFVPGFAYMAEVDSRIAAPRRRTPRTEVTPGSVAIAGAQTGVYPAPTPGGWNIIGRTPLRPYDPTRDPPSLFAPGNLVRFVPIEPDEFRTLSGESDRSA